MASTEMTTINRGRFTISANIVITTSTLTRTMIVGCVSLFLITKDKAFNRGAQNTRKMFEKPLGFTVESIGFSFPGLLLLELLTGLFGLIGVLFKKKSFLVVAVAFGLLIVAVYIIYITLLVLVYSELWCSDCENARTYFETYLGITVTCLVSHVVSLIAIDYTYRKCEFKEKRRRLSSNKFYLLLSRQYGVGKTVVNTIQSVWKRSKVEFFSVTTKVILLILHLGLLGLGLTLCGDVFITNGQLRYIFYKIKFYQYYFYDILVGLAASAIFTGTIGIIQDVISLIAAWKKSIIPYVVSCLFTTINLVPKFLVIIIYAVFINEINSSMLSQLELQQDGYYFNNEQSTLTRSWNKMILLLNCCGVQSYNDTFNSNYGSWFCREYADETNRDIDDKILYPAYPNDGYKHQTCSSKILRKTRMYIGWFFALLVMQISLGMICILLENKEYSRRFQPSSQEEIKSKLIVKCHQVLSIYRLSWTKVKTVVYQNCKRSKETVIYLTALGIIFVLNMCLLVISINIRYDYIFGDKDIKTLLNNITTANINFVTALFDWSTVVTTAAVAVLSVTFYSALTLASDKSRFALFIVGLGFWIVLTITNILEIGLWGKFMVELGGASNQSIMTKLEQEMLSYAYEQNSAFYRDNSFSWNTLFVVGKCCGIHNNSFNDTEWFQTSLNKKVPVQCCSSQTMVYPYQTKNDSTCTNNGIGIYSQSCASAITNRLWNNYSTPFITLSSLVLAAEITCIITLVRLIIKKKDEAGVEPIRVNSINDEVASTELTGSNVDSETKAAINTEQTNPSNDIEEASNDQGFKQSSV